MSQNISFHITNPANLSQTQYTTIAEIESDMWGRKEGLGTYMHCCHCNATFSKQDVYKGKISPETYLRTVTEIEAITQRKYLYCPCCAKHLEPVFDITQYVKDIQERYSSNALLLLVQDSDGQIIGFMDGHISPFEVIFERDLSYRYQESMVPTIINAIKGKINGVLPERMFSCSSMGTIEQYMSFPMIYAMLQSFFGAFPEEYESDFGISELNDGNSLSKIYRCLGAKSLEINGGAEKYKTTTYKSELFLQESLGRKYKEGFKDDLKTFLRRHKGNLK